MSILCCSPQIIINKSHHVNQVYRNRSDWRIILRGQESFVVPSPRKARIKLDELDDCYYLNVKSGQMIPMYLEVPCQKCIICKDKKALEWATRITCESNYHINCPWWITLTYNDFNLPEFGLEKSDVQKFLKRLRERVSRKLGHDCPLRYVLVGEYGSNYARAHYHLILFGMPKMSPREVLTIIENSWSKRVSKDRYIELESLLGQNAMDYRFIRHDIHGKPLYYERIGFAYVKPAHDNTPLYLAKYMFKPEVNTPVHKNPNFCLSSRKNGIGYDYIIEYGPYHRANPHLTKIEFRNKHTGKLCSFGIPQYYKDYWFPTPSKIVPTEVRSSYQYIQSMIVDYCQCQRFLNDKYGFDTFDDLDSIIAELNNKYFFWEPLIKCGSDYSQLEKEWHRNCVKTIYADTGYFTLKSDDGHKFGLKYYEEITTTLQDYVRNKMLASYMVVQREYDYLMSLQFDMDWMRELLTLRDKYKGAITQYMLSQPLKSVEDKVFELKKCYEKLKSKDRY